MFKLHFDNIVLLNFSWNSSQLQNILIEETNFRRAGTRIRSCPIVLCHPALLVLIRRYFYNFQIIHMKFFQKHHWTQWNNFLAGSTLSCKLSSTLFLRPTCSWNKIYNFQSSFLCWIQIWPVFYQHIRVLRYL